MEKILALVLALCLLCGGTAMADATTINQDSTSKTANTTVSYTIATNETYTVTIPSAVTLTGTGSLSGTLPIRLQTPNFNVTGKTITVKLTSTANGLKLKLANSTSEIAYTLKAAGVEYKAGDTLLSWTYDGETTEKTLPLVAGATLSSNLLAGEYTDTLTFTVSVTGGSSGNGGIAGDAENPGISNQTVKN